MRPTPTVPPVGVGRSLSQTTTMKITISILILGIIAALICAVTGDSPPGVLHKAGGEYRNRSQVAADLFNQF